MKEEGGPRQGLQESDENKNKIISDYQSCGNKELDTDHFDIEPVLDNLNQKQPDTTKIF